ncbi:MAG TPA: hypothetical protein VE912_09190, partial [Bacteroidales bacterium]|nr:hypothetical protein [Bacteroidales bacterium]
SEFLGYPSCWLSLLLPPIFLDDRRISMISDTDQYKEFRSFFLKLMSFEDEPNNIPPELEIAIQDIFATNRDAAERCHVFLEPSIAFKKPKITITDNRK